MVSICYCMAVCNCSCLWGADRRGPLQSGRGLFFLESKIDLAICKKSFAFSLSLSLIIPSNIKNAY